MEDHIRVNGLMVSSMGKENIFLSIKLKNGVNGMKEKEQNGLMKFIKKNDIIYFKKIIILFHIFILHINRFYNLFIKIFKFKRKF